MRHRPAADRIGHEQLRRRRPAHPEERSNSCNSPLAGLPKKSVHKRHDRTSPLQVIHQRRPPHAPPPCFRARPAITWYCSPPPSHRVTCRISASIWIKSPDHCRPAAFSVIVVSVAAIAARQRERRRTVQFVPVEQRQRPRRNRVRIRQSREPDPRPDRPSPAPPDSTQTPAAEEYPYPRRLRRSADLPARQRIQFVRALLIEHVRRSPRNLHRRARPDSAPRISTGLVAPTPPKFHVASATTK